MKIARILKDLISYTRVKGDEILIPNFYVGNYELDLFRLNKNGYLYEYEIKLSRSDYFRDFEKSRWAHDPDRKENKKILKHDELKTGKLYTNKFIFVCPKGLIDKKEIPDYAGLLEYDSNSFHLLKRPRFLHKRSFDEYKWLAHKMAYIIASAKADKRNVQVEREIMKKQAMCSHSNTKELYSGVYCQDCGAELKPS